MKHSFPRLAFATIVLLTGLMYGSISAQTAVKAFKVGDRVEMNVANDIQNDDKWISGTVKEVLYTDDHRIMSYRVLRDDEGYVQQFGNLARVIRPGVGAAPLPTAVRKVPDNGTPTAVYTNDGEAADCDFAKYPEVKASMKFSEAFIKAELYERYVSRTNTGSLTSPLAAGLTFLSIQIRSPYTNVVKVVPGRGATRKQDGAPPNAKIYPFSAKYIVCNKYNKEVTRTQYESDFVCFIDKGGNWNCPVDSVPKITHLN